jgi:hypothetical protein
MTGTALGDLAEMVPREFHPYPIAGRIIAKNRGVER